MSKQQSIPFDAINNGPRERPAIDPAVIHEANNGPRIEPPQQGPKTDRNNNPEGKRTK